MITIVKVNDCTALIPLNLILKCMKFSFSRTSKWFWKVHDIAKGNNVKETKYFENIFSSGLIENSMPAHKNVCMAVWHGQCLHHILWAITIISIGFKPLRLVMSFKQSLNPLYYFRFLVSIGKYFALHIFWNNKV